MKKHLFSVLFASTFLSLQTVYAANITGKLIDLGTKKGVEGAVVYIAKAPGKFKPSERVVMNQINKEFHPLVLPVLVGSKVWFENGDDVKHEIYSFSPLKKFNLPLFGKGQKPQPVTMDKAGVIHIGCNIHDWMSATLVVTQNPFFDVSSSDGSFVISGIPAGKYDLTFFHPGGKPVVQKVTLPLAKPVVLASKFRPIAKKVRPANDRGSGGRY